ncbi:MAG TPA: hypothetical protein VGP41_16495 [Candidatus Lustribacter sp.]|jgi:hypothetical protein|nr:hypothetical protein [Candidatus Lustribacter sp.]
MKSFATKLLIAIFGFSLVSAPLAASAAQWGVGIGINAGGVAVRGGYSNGWRPGGYYHGYGYGYRPAPVAWRPAPAPYYVDGYYGLAPGGFYGYYWHGGWYAHRRWHGGVWIYF